MALVMATYRSNPTAPLLMLAVLALACTPTTEETASDAAATDTDTDTTAATGTTAAGTDTTAGTDETDSTTVVPGATDPTTTAGTDTTTAGTDTDTTGIATDTSGTDTDPTDTDTDTGADACPAHDPALGNIGVKSGPEGAPDADCTVASASNAGGTVVLDLLCDPLDVNLKLAVPTDFAVDLEGLTEVKFSVGGDPFFEGTSFVVHDLATGEFVLAAYQMNGFSTYPELAPIALKEVGSCGSKPCSANSQIEFSHADGPSVALFPGSRDTLSAGGRDYDIVLASAWEDLCEEHSGSYAWIIGASASK